jgi:ABC-type polysaccharide/polyol phosphate export permease
VYGIFGVTIAAGPAGIALLIAYAMVLALVIGGFAALLALRTGSAEAVQNVFPVTFIGLFISSAFFPTEMMTGAYRSIARRNPITWMVDGMRHQVIVGLDWSEAAVSISVAVLLAILAIFGANHALQTRLRRAS